jgi:hypothetical protein
MVIGESKKINFLSKLIEVKTHDYQLLKYNFEEGNGWFKQKIIRIDLGFLGMKRTMRWATLHSP